MRSTSIVIRHKVQLRLAELSLRRRIELSIEGSRHFAREVLPPHAHKLKRRSQRPTKDVDLEGSHNLTSPHA
jgi:hypothetical protein